MSTPRSATLRAALLFSLLLSAGLPAQVDEATAAAIRREGIENSHAIDYLRELTSEIGHRLTGSDNFTEACYWAAGQFEEMGLDVHLEKWGEWNLVWNRGVWNARVVGPEPFEMWIATPAWTAGTDGVVRGRLVRMPDSPDALERQGSLEGLFLWGQPPRGDFGGELEARAEEDGAAGFLYAARGNEEYPNRIRVFGSSRVARGSIDDVPTVPEVVVRADHAARLESLLGGDDPIVIELELGNRFRPGPIPLHNVVAELKGTEEPDEYVVVCGHLDSWHQATGTTDNGTGATSTLEAARILSTVGARPRRTIRFILWGGEEQGLLGSVAHVRRHRDEMSRVSAVFNHDTGTNWAHSLGVTEAMAKDLRGVFEPVMALTPPDEDHDGPVFDLRIVEAVSGRGGSDHASFLSAGVPAWFWGLTGRADYGRTWHTQWDTVDAAIPEYQRHTSTVGALAALGTANLPGLLDRENVERRRRRGGVSRYLNPMFDATFDGLKLKEVEEEGVAAKAGFQAGDVLESVNGRAIERGFEIFIELRDEPETLEFTVQRGEEKVKIAVDPKALSRRRRGG